MKKILFAFLILSALPLTFVFASNYSFLNSAPAAYFNNQDWKIMMLTSQKALNHSKDGQKTFWKNAQSGNFGYVIPSHTHKEQGTLCRDLTFFNNGDQRINETTYKMCKMGNEWKQV